MSQPHNDISGDRKETYRATAVRGSVFVVSAQALKVFLTFLSLVVLSRYLTPDDFGLIACMAPIISFLVLFQDVGLQQSVIQREDISHDQLNRIFWAMVAIGMACMVLLWLASPAIAWFYNDPRLLILTIASSLSLVLISISSLPSSLMSRRMQFKSLAIIDIAANLVGFVGGIGGAVLGLGYWSLILSSLFVALVTAGSTLVASQWRPSRPRFWPERDILHFGAHLTGFNVVNFFARNLDNILIGRYWGTQELGYYDRAYKLLLFPLATLNYPLSRVVIPILSRVQNDKSRVRDIYLRTLGLLSLAVVPGMAAATFVSYDIIFLLFGEAWADTAPLFCWLGLAGLIQPIIGSCGWLFISQGNSKEMLRWGLFSSSTTILSFIIGLPYGALGVAGAYVVSEYAIRLPCLFWYMGRVGPVKAHDFLKILMPLLAAAGTTFLCVHFVLSKYLGLTGIPLILGSFSLSYFISIGVLAMYPYGRSVLAEAFSLLSIWVRKHAESKN